MAIAGRAPGADFDVRDQIIAFKRKLAPRREALQRAYADVKDHVTRAVDIIRTEVAAGRAVVPELDYRDEAVAAGAVHLFRALVGARAERRQRSPARGTEAHRNARARVVERLHDVAGETLEAIDVAPRRSPVPEVGREFIGRRVERCEMEAERRIRRLRRLDGGVAHVGLEGLDGPAVTGIGRLDLCQDAGNVTRAGDAVFEKPG